MEATYNTAIIDLSCGVFNVLYNPLFCISFNEGNQFHYTSIASNLVTSCTAKTTFTHILRIDDIFQ